jgi:hypothetical protein
MMSADTLGEACDDGSLVFRITEPGTRMLHVGPCRLVRVLASGRGSVAIRDGAHGQVFAAGDISPFSLNPIPMPGKYVWLTAGCELTFAGTGYVSVFLDTR